MMMLGMCAWLLNDYEIMSNKETGKGRCDIILKARHRKDTSFVIELKYGKKEDELDELASKAIQQIDVKQYDCGIEGRVIDIGLAHVGKEVKMQWIEKEDFTKIRRKHL